MPDWRQVTPAEAMRHPLYGVGGWLLFFMILQMIGIAINLYGLTHAVIGMQVVSAVVGIGFNVINLVLCFSLSRWFPSVAIAFLWIGVALGLITILTIASMIDGQPPRPGLTGQLAIVFIATVVAACLMNWYLVSSKRVKLTFRHRVPGY